MDDKIVPYRKLTNRLLTTSLHYKSVYHPFTSVSLYESQACSRLGGWQNPFAFDWTMLPREDLSMPAGVPGSYEYIY